MRFRIRLQPRRPKLVASRKVSSGFVAEAAADAAESRSVASCPEGPLLPYADIRRRMLRRLDVSA